MACWVYSLSMLWLLRISRMGDGPMGEVTNEDYVNALVHFANGARGMLESCRVINGARCDMSFEIYGTRGTITVNI
jgi:predicted dehydrogenase